MQADDHLSESVIFICLHPCNLNMDEWLITENGYQRSKNLYWESIFALANGYMGMRGTLEESSSYSDIKSCSGTYVAGVFDSYNKQYQAIVNLPNYFNTQICVGGDMLNVNTGKINGYTRSLDMHRGVLTRRFVWTNKRNQTTRFEITRFLSISDPHIAVAHFKIKPLNYSGNMEINNILDANVSNIDFHVSGYQLRDEKYFLIDDTHEKGKIKNGTYITVQTKTTKHKICELFKTRLAVDEKEIKCRNDYKVSHRYISNKSVFRVTEAKEYTFLKTIAVYTTRDNKKDIKRAALSKADESLKKGYLKLLQEHTDRWKERWNISDIKIDGNKRDQQSLRFLIYHLIQMGNKNDPRVNIGSRGLTSEMHYGNCFWDTEIFILSFFIYTHPETAKALLKYRYLTLPAARQKAKKLWFEGAMFPWMSSFPGHEQADNWEYANAGIHIVSDVAYAVMHYYNATGDDNFMLNYGLELLIETSRFWASRVYFNPRKGRYVINNVKGPNEYAGVVNNNSYTNWNARFNLRSCIETVNSIRKRFQPKFKMISKKLSLSPAELRKWKSIAENIYINYDKKSKLFIEDDMFLDKRPVEMKKVKPGKEIATESGITWDTLLRHRVVKQADVILMMYLHNNMFTREQKENAWKYYEKLTLHDSSLSYNTHAIMAAELGYKSKSYDYFQKSARLDLDDVMKNVFLGIHSACLGGTWQTLINGFCGMRLYKDKIEFVPRLPEQWRNVQFKIIYRGNLLNVKIEGSAVKVNIDKKLKNSQNVKVFDKKVCVLK
ncbi:MAG: glycoside hydrolase family 65 protein [Elusimicrobia bacterium]|nr:glycoside hydrolase family 65 protein [Elusimicrobiota bacterium]